MKLMRNLSVFFFASMVALVGIGCTQQVKLTGTGVTPPAPGLTLNATTLPFGNVYLDQTATQTIVMTSSGTANVTVSSITIQGSEFSLVAPTLPLVLAPNATGQIQVTFAPTVAGSATGSVQVVSNALTSPVQTVTASATAVNGTVVLNWNAPVQNPSDLAVGYNVYREIGTSGVFTQINPSVIPLATTTYTDNTGTSGSTYHYYVESVDAVGATSVPSNTVTVTLP